MNSWTSSQPIFDSSETVYIWLASNISLHHEAYIPQSIMYIDGNSMTCVTTNFKSMSNEDFYMKLNSDLEFQLEYHVYATGTFATMIVKG